QLHGGVPVGRVGGAGKHDDGDALGLAVGAEMLEEIEAGAVGAEADVDDGNVGRLVAGGADGLVRRRPPDHAVGRFRQRGPHERADVGIVVEDEDHCLTIDDHDDSSASVYASPMKFETLAVHAGAEPDPSTAALAPPIHLSTTFEHAPDGAMLHGFMYIRDGNPTQSRLEASLAAIDSAAGALAFASGM